MKKLLLLLLIFPSIIHAQSITLDSLHREFERYLTGPKQPDVEIEGKTYQTHRLKFQPATGTLLAAFTKDNSRILLYLGMNFRALKDEYLYWHDSDSVRFSKGKELPDSVWRNLYFERLTQIMVRYLQAKEHLSIDGIVLNHKPIVSCSYLQAYVAKFYYPDSIQPNGGIRTHICIGFNGYRDAAPPRNLMLEAVAYSIANERIL